MPQDRPDPRGVALCLTSAVGFGAMAVLAKAAFAGGASIPTVLGVRFALAAVVLWAALAVRRHRAGPRPTRPSAGGRLPAVALGLLYTVEAACFFFAVSRIDAALAELLLYGYPALVVLGAALLGREALTPARAQALLLSTAGLALVLAAGGIGDLDALGVTAGLATAVLYAAYVLLSDRVVATADPLETTVQIVTVAAVCFLGYGAATGELSLALTPTAWAAILAITLLSTVVGIITFLQGLRLVGPSTATLISMVEPVFAVALAMVVLGERLGPLQLVGGALVVAALARLAGVGQTAVDEPAADRAPAAPAGPLREGVAVG